MKKQVVALLLIVILTAAVALPGVTAQEAGTTGLPWWTACENDLTGETVTFYHFGDLSGAYKDITAPLVRAFEDASAYINANGGLCGATVAQEYEDTGGNQESTQAAWDRFSEVAPSVFLYGSADGELLREQAAEKEVVLFNAAGSEKALYGEAAEPEPGWQFSIIPLYTDQMGAFCDFVAVPENRETLGIDGDPVIGHLTWPGAFGQASDTDATDAYCESLGVQVIDDPQIFLPTTLDVSQLATALLDQGANILYTTTLGPGPAAVAGTVAALALENPPLVAGPNWVLDTSVIGLGGAASIGIVGNLPYLWWDEVENPGVQLVLSQWVQNYLSTATTEEEQRAALGVRGLAYMTAFASIDMWGEAMIRTINRVGLENANGAAFYETLQDFQYDALQGVMRVDYTEGQRAGQTTRIGQIQANPDGGIPVILPLSDWVDAPDLRSNGGADVPG